MRKLLLTHKSYKSKANQPWKIGSYRNSRDKNWTANTSSTDMYVEQMVKKCQEASKHSRDE